MYAITMNGPARNALGTEMMTWLLDQLAAARVNAEPVLLTGQGDAFCSGLNLKEVAGLDPAGMEVFLRRLDALIAALFTHPGPTVALVNGHAIAGGCVLALCCDHRVATPDARTRIGLNEVAIGLRFPPRILAMVRQRVPAQHHEAVLLGAGLHDPQESLRLGLLDEVTAHAPEAAHARLSTLASHPRAAYAATKADLRAHTMDLRPDDERRFVTDVLPTWTSPEVKARVLAVLKR